MESVTVSIIMPAYNAEEFLRQTVATVQAQTVREWELILVDDGSSDGTFDLASQLAASDGRIRPFRKENGGVGTARNFGIERLSGRTQYVALLDHDDLWEPDALEQLIEALRGDPDAVAAHGLAKVSARDGSSAEVLGGNRRKLVQGWMGIRAVACLEREPTTFAVLAYDGCLCTPGMALIRRTVIAGMQPFRQDLAPSDDFDFWVRLSLRGHFAFVNRVVIEWRQHESNVSGDKRLIADALARNRAHIVNLPDMTESQRRLAVWRYRRMYASIIRHNAADYRAWAGEAVRDRKPGVAIEYAGRSCRLTLNYLRLRLLWPSQSVLDPLPARARDARQLRVDESAAA